MPHECGRANLVVEVEAFCRTRGRWFTQHRHTLLDAMLTVGRPVTAYELLDLVRPDGAAITSASIYRSLDFLIDMGLVHRPDSTR